MKTVKLGEFMVERGGSLNPRAFPSEKFELYSIPAHDLGGPEYVTGSNIGSAKQIVRPGDTMLAKIIPHIRRARVVGPKQGFRQIASGEWILFRGDAFFPAYMRHFLLGDVFHAQFINTVAGVGGSLVRARPHHVKNIQLPLPPIREQRRIAAILDLADALRAKRREVLAHLNALSQAIFRDMFVDLIWSGTLSDLADVQIGPFGSLLHREDYVVDGVPILNPMHIQAGSLRPDPQFSVTEEKAAKLAAYRLQVGDVVMGRRGEMGRAGVASVEHEGMLCGTGSLILRPKGVNSTFLHSIVTSHRMKEHLERAALGATLPNLNAGIVQSSPAPLTARDLQDDFAAKVDGVHAQCSASERAWAAEDELFASLQHRAFGGEL